MSISNINVRVDSDLKKKAQNIFKELGLNMTSAINIFLEKAVNNKNILFEFEDKIPNEEIKLAIAECEKMKNLHGPFDSAEEAVASMLED